MIEKNLNLLKKMMKENGIDFYIIPTSDFHSSEIAGAFFKGREYLSGFTGSAGTLLVTQEESFLYVDGRYFIQGEKQTEGTSIKLMKMGQPECIDMEKMFGEYTTKVVGFDGRCFASDFVEKIDNPVVTHLDLVDAVWQDRPELSHQPIYDYDVKYCGQSRLEKLEAIRADLEADCHIVTTLDDIAYIFNLRGNDITHTPVFYGYALITKTDATLYVQKGTITKELEVQLANDNIEVKEYFAVYEDVKNIEGTVLLDKKTVNYQIVSSIPGKIISQTNPSTIMKAIKNETEIANTRTAHIKDGIAMTKFMCYLKQNAGKTEMDELSLDAILTQYRQKQPDFKQLSFGTICGYEKNGALMHYSANENQFSKVEPKGLLLIDSGGQYLQGTTDTTRTFVMGEITEKQRHHFTLVFKAMNNLQHTNFLYGKTGVGLDILARGVIQAENLDYQCGTGHGVGHYLSVHEGPQGMRPFQRPGTDDVKIEAGMIITDEPGIYIENEYGIRLENELLAVNGEKNFYGQFMHFDILTMVPIDIDGIDFNILEQAEIKQLLDYQKTVYENVEPALNENEKNWYLTTMIEPIKQYL